MSFCQSIGQQAEALACHHLEQHGLVLVCRNYRCPFGEIDLIMRDQAYLVFVEVRVRRHQDYGSGVDSISRQKCRHIIRSASHYLQQHDLYDRVDCRFDIVDFGSEENLQWIQNAFEVE